MLLLMNPVVDFAKWGGPLESRPLSMTVCLSRAYIPTMRHEFEHAEVSLFKIVIRFVRPD